VKSAAHRIRLFIGVLLCIACGWASAQVAPPQVQAGQSLTQLANGNWLIVGAPAPTGTPPAASTALFVLDRATGKTSPLPWQLNLARSGQTSTLLSDGRVLILGGVGLNGAPGLPPEILDLVAATATALPDPGLIPRSQHTATLMADGRILVTGGLDASAHALFEAELINTTSFALEHFNVRTESARFSHLAQWLPSNAVLLSGGTGQGGQPIANGEIYDAASYRFAPVTAAEVQRLLSSLAGLQPAIMVGTAPAEGATGVPIDSTVVLRFSKWMDPASLNSATVVLSGGGQVVKTRIVGAERGLLLFVTPGANLLPNTDYTLIVNGAVDAAGQSLFAATLHFQTGTGRISPVNTPVNTAASAVVPGAATSNAAVNVPTLATARRLLSSLPLSFEENAGQYPDDVKFTTRGYDYQLMLTSRSAIIGLRQPQHDAGTNATDANDETPKTRDARDRQVRARSSNRHALLRLRFEGANPSPATVGQEIREQRSHYIGADVKSMPSEGAANYARVLYQGVYPGIDQAYYGNQGRLEYDWLVAPGADPGQIVQAFDGAKSAVLNDTGDLVLTVGEREVTFKKPVAYQDLNGVRTPVEVNYKAVDARKFGFTIGTYDNSQPLVIDPTVVYSTFLGGNGYDYVTGVALDSAGNLYVSGTVYSSSFPQTTGAFFPYSEIFVITDGNAYNYDREATFVSKFNAAGTSLLFSTYIVDSALYAANPAGIAVGSDGGIYVAGRGVYSSLFNTNLSGISQRSAIPSTQLTPVANGQKNGSGSYIFKMSAAGNSLNFITAVTDVYVYAFALDPSGYLYIGGYATAGTTFVPTTGAAQATASTNSVPGFLAKINTTGTAFVYATYFGGTNGNTTVRSLAVDASGSAYFAGSAVNSVSGLPVINAFQSTHGPSGTDGIFGKLNASGTAFNYASYYDGGAGGTQLNGVTIDWIGNAYLVGSTGSGALRVNDSGFVLYSSMPSGQGAVVAKVNQTGSVTFASTMANTGAAYGAAVNVAGDLYVVGYANPGANTLVNDLGKGGTGSASDAFVAKIPADAGTPALFATIGGSAADVAYTTILDQAGNVYVAGGTASTNFPVLNAEQGTFVNTGTFKVGNFFNNGTPQQAFIVKISDPSPLAVHLTSSLNPAPVGQSVTFTAIVTGNAPTGSVTFNDGTTSLGTFALVNGVATLATSGLGVGSHSITATYGGNANNASLASSVLVQTVQPNLNGTVTATALSSNISGQVALNTNLVFTAQVTGSNPTGAVLFADNGVQIATVPVSAGAAVFNTTGVVSGGHNVVATYVGDVANRPSGSNTVNYSVIMPPTITFTMPANGTSVSLPASILLGANAASNNGGSVVMVRYLLGSTELGRATSSPYQFTWQNALPGAKTITAEATDTVGQVTTTTINLTLVEPALGISALSPPDGTMVSGDSVTVSGIVAGPLGSGVNVNGVPAQINGTAFVAPNVPLSVGSNTLTITATAPDGTVSTQTIQVVAGSAPMIKLVASPDNGVAPLNTTFSIAGANSGTVTQIDADFDGDGVTDQSFTDFSSAITHAYANPGTYQAKFTITSSAGAPVSQTITIVVQDIQTLDQQLQIIWNGFLAKLKDGNTAGALSVMTQDAQAKFQPIFASQGATIATFVDSVGPIVDGSISDGLAEYLVSVQTPSGVQGYRIYMLRDASGVWRIAEM
jgi:hypothetical protein